MIRFADDYPRYEFNAHKGYPTKKHKYLISKYGLSAIVKQSLPELFAGFLHQK